MDEEKDRELVPFLLDFKASLDKILEESFAKNEAFSNTIKDSFEHLINLRQVSDLIFIVLLDWCFSYCLFIDVNVILFVDVFLLSSIILFIILSGYDVHVVIM
jgi:hypothetical protein